MFECDICLSTRHMFINNPSYRVSMAPLWCSGARIHLQSSLYLINIGISISVMYLSIALIF